MPFMAYPSDIRPILAAIKKSGASKWWSDRCREEVMRKCVSNLGEHLPMAYGNVQIGKIFPLRNSEFRFDREDGKTFALTLDQKNSIWKCRIVK